MKPEDVPPSLSAYTSDLTDERVIYGDPGDGYAQHAWPCSCGCKPVTQAEAVERTLRYRGLWPPMPSDIGKFNRAIQEEARKPHPAVTLHAVGARVLCAHRLIPQLNYPQSDGGYECEKCGMLFVPYDVPAPRDLAPVPAESTADPEEAFSGRERQS